MNILELHIKFRRECALEEQLSSATIKAFKSSMMTFVKRTGVESMADITLDVLRGFFHEGMEKYQWSYSSFVNYHKYLKKFFEWCIREKYMGINPILAIKKPKKPKSLPRRLSYEDAQKILHCTLGYKWFYGFECPRNYAIIATFLYAGLRAKELINLRLIDIDLNNGNILINKGKGGKDRNVPIHSKLINILKYYIRERERWNKESEYLFVGAQSNSLLQYRDIAKICKKISIKSGVKFTPHCLRHTFGSVAVEQGIGVVQLKEIMGHSDIASTMIYMSMSSKNLQESLNRVELF